MRVFLGWHRQMAIVALLVAATASPVFGQGFYYKEITREGRIYVFNIAAEAERFEKTGEMGRGLTRPGAGPNGETVVGDSERALQLFFFKHGISEVVIEPPAPIQTMEWRDGKTRITTNLAYLEISNRIQVRYTHEFPDELSPVLAGTAAAGDSRGSFRIRRAKLKLEGWFWRPPDVAPAPAIMPRLSYELQLNWPDVTAANSPGNMLEDANIAWDPQGRGKFRVLAGQFKVPFGRQEMTSSGNQQFVDRSLVSNEYARGRDTGFAVQGAVWSNKLEYRAGFFNGAGRTRTTNDNDSLQVNARLMWQPNGNQVLAQRAWISGALYSESDFESTTVPLYALAVEFEHNDFHRTTTGNDTKSNVIGVDGIFKYKGFSATGEYFVRRRTPETGEKFDSNGGYVQVGQMLNQFRTWEAAFRYGQREVSDLVADDTHKEMRGAFSYYYRRHTLKFQVDFGRVEIPRNPGQSARKDHEVRLQTQFIF
ncbi:MAG TPA: porin [Vicinamibacterales bacterium]|nr:porin [Vicinamibacterales bacterium]